MSELSIVRLTKDHPLRPTDWRWVKASYLRDNKQEPYRSHDDTYIVRALDFQRRLFACRSDMERLNLYDDYRDIYTAYELRDQDDTASEQDKSARRKRSHPMRWELEARLLAKELYASIAQRLNATIESIAWYEALFFNVRDRINSQSWVLNEVIGPALHRGMSDRDYDLLLKLYGYYCGPFMVDSMVSTFVGPPRIVGLDQIDNTWVTDTRTTIRRKSAVAARTLPINSFNQIQILELNAKLIELEQQGEVVDAASEVFDGVKAFMGEIKFSIGKEAMSRIDPTLLPHYAADQAAEPRAAELILVDGQEVSVPRSSKFPVA